MSATGKNSSVIIKRTPKKSGGDKPRRGYYQLFNIASDPVASLGLH